MSASDDSERLSFEVFGSAGDIYLIRAYRAADGEVTMFCGCDAGSNGLHCKHRRALIVGDGSAIVTGSENLELLQGWLPGTELARVVADVLDAEQVAEDAKLRLKRAKSRFSTIIDGH